MLVSQRPMSEPSVRQGCLREVLADLQRRGATPDGEKGLRQRLLALAERLARVRALGDEYARVGFSDDVQKILGEHPSAT